MGLFPSDTYRLGVANRDPEEEALGWVVRMTSGEAAPADHEEFEDWQADAENAQAYARARRLWAGIGPVLADQEAAGWPAAKEEPAPVAAHGRHMPRFTKIALIAASVSTFMLGGLHYVRVGQFDQVSGAGAIENVALKDGSTVALGPDTALNSDFRNGARHISLARGEAFFDVRHDPAHPFVVSSGNGVVRVLGTAFSVRRKDDGGVTVTVARGRVQVTSGARSEFLTPDRQISFGASGLGKMRAVDASLATAWMRGRLIMENRSLGDVLLELDRYRGGRIVLLNKEAAQRRINAVIDLRRTDGWLTALASSQGLTLTDLGPVTVIR